MARIPQVTRESVPERLRATFDEVSAGPGGVGTGPMSVLKHSPEMSRRAIPLFGYVRNESTVPKKLRELAMITTARAMDCPYIWHAHAAEARAEGLDNAWINALRDGTDLPTMADDEQAVFNFGMEMFRARRVTPQTFQTVRDLLGDRGLVELTTLFGFYTMLAFNANAVELDLPHDSPEPPLPI